MRTLFTLTAAALCGTIDAQGVITRISEGEHFFYYENDLVPVFAAISPLGHDTIILPGGQVNASDNLIIQWPVVIIGAGIRADSSLAYGGKTEIIGHYQRNLQIMENADGTEFHGLSFLDDQWANVGFGNNIATSGADNVRFVRCEIPDLKLGYNYQGSNAHNALVQECVIKRLDVCQGHEPLIRSSFVSALMNCPAASNATLENCIFLNYDLAATEAADYRNCIFLRNQATVFNVNQVSSTFANSLFVGSASGFSVNFAVGVTQSGTNTTTNLSAGANRAFESGVTSFTNWEPLANYHSGPQWQTSGNDGSQLGIFGGSLPWKAGSVPFNPHWRGLSQTGSTSNGTIQNVQIRGSAQTH